MIKMKPVDYDIHFKYLCPKRCGYVTWLSLREAKEKNFKIVCDCGTVYKPKPITGINILYEEKLVKPLPKVEIPEPQPVYDDHEDFPLPEPSVSSQEQPVVFELSKFLDECCDTLISMGFDKQEAMNLCKESYNKNPTEDVVKLVKQILLDTFGGNTNVESQTV